MNHEHNNRAGADVQVSGDLRELQNILNTINADALLSRLASRQTTGRPGYPVSALWRAYVASFALNVPNTNSLIRRLEGSAELRLLCGLNGVPHRTTLTNFIARLADHRDMIALSMQQMTDLLAVVLHGFGDMVALDSTTVRTHGNPHRTILSDPEASWTAKNSARAKGANGKEWHYGYKLHLVADATYGLPIEGYVTTAKRNDSPELPVLMDTAKRHHGWFRPRYVMADRGYDSLANHKTIQAHNATPVIPIRKPANADLYEGVYTTEGAPVCLGMKPMEWVKTSPDKGHLYRCSAEGCHLKERRGVHHCAYTVWENRQDNPRLFPAVRRNSDEWNRLYPLRQSVERVFKSLKQSRRLEAHCVRGLKHIALHCDMALLVFQATSLVRFGHTGAHGIAWQVEKVA